MREILFRGYSEDEGGWVYGDYAPATSIFPDNIYPQLRDDEEGYSEGVAVTPETVGQYTGMKDINGIRIFEGDILHDVQSDYEYQMKWFEDYGCFALANKHGNMDVEYTDIFIEDMLIVGNVHDNPEWLNGGTAEKCIFDKGDSCSALKSHNCTDCSFRKTSRKNRGDLEKSRRRLSEIGFSHQKRR